MPPLDDADAFSKRTRVERSFASFEEDTVHLLQPELAGATHLVATRKGLYAVNETEWTQVAYGFFFGITLRGDDIFVFEACDQPHSPLQRGRIVRFTRKGDRIASSSVVAKGLDCGCHQIDFIDTPLGKPSRLHVMDTYNQVVLRFAEDEGSWETLMPLPMPTHRRLNFDPAYLHVNSMLQVGGTILLLLHNKFVVTGKPSEVALFDLEWNPLARWVVDGRECHGLALLEDGTLLTCDSMRGDIISAQGFRKSLGRELTRGLAVGEDSIVVGVSVLAPRGERMSSHGTVRFLDRDYRERAALALPGAPTEVRRLDGQDAGLSGYLQTMPWGSLLREGVPSEN